MTIYDITRVMQQAPLYPGSEECKMEPISSIAGGDAYNLTKITADSHIGTHADAESHFIDGGKTIDEMPIRNYCGKCRLITFSGGMVKLSDLRGRLEGCERVALRGGAFLTEEAAEYLVMCRTKLIVTDAISVAPADNERAIHEILLESGCAIVENAVLEGMHDGDYIIFAPPVKYGGCDGAPVRALLIGE